MSSENGLTEVWTPVLVRDEAMFGTGQLPKFAEDSYQTTNGWWLIPTSEVTLTNLVAGQILDDADLPMRMTAHTQCFRSEAGSAGKDTAGMLRQHQFEKVEMVSITAPGGQPGRARPHDRLRRGHPRSSLACPTGRWCSPPATWASARGAPTTSRSGCPGQDTFREISSCSVCGDFQARRMNARFRRERGREARVRPHPERLGPRGRAHADRGAGERPGGGRLGHAARGAGALSRRAAPHHAPRACSWPDHARGDGTLIPHYTTQGWLRAAGWILLGASRPRNGPCRTAPSPPSPTGYGRASP